MDRPETEKLPEKKDGDRISEAPVFTLNNNQARNTSNFDGLKTPGFTKTKFDFNDHDDADSDNGRLDNLSDDSQMRGYDDDDVSSIHSYQEYQKRNNKKPVVGKTFKEESQDSDSSSFAPYQEGSKRKMKNGGNIAVMTFEQETQTEQSYLDRRLESSRTQTDLKDVAKPINYISDR